MLLALLRCVISFNAFVLMWDCGEVLSGMVQVGGWFLKERAADLLRNSDQLIIGLFSATF